MKPQHLAAIPLLAIALAGCSKPVTVSGEVFIRESNGTIREPGVLICFMSEKQHAQFEQKLAIWRQTAKQNAIDSMQKAYEEYNAITKGHTRSDGKVYEEDIGKANFERMTALESRITKTTETLKDWEYRLPNLGREDINRSIEPLPEPQYCITNSDGKFDVELKSDEPVWVYCVSENRSVAGMNWHYYWHFRYLPGKAELILSTENGRSQEN